MSEAKKPPLNWLQYNEHLVQRGEILLSVESLKGWQQELEEINQGKGLMEYNMKLRPKN